MCSFFHIAYLSSVCVSTKISFCQLFCAKERTMVWRNAEQFELSVSATEPIALGKPRHAMPAVGNALKTTPTPRCASIQPVCVTASWATTHHHTLNLILPFAVKVNDIQQMTVVGSEVRSIA